ncbi:DNA-directed RNA polymerases IV and V subunit 2-like protein [Tanacetum coccineum]
MALASVMLGEDPLKLLAAIWSQPWRASDITSDVAGLSLFIKPSEHEGHVIVIHTGFATTTRVMEKPDTAEKENEVAIWSHPWRASDNTSDVARLSLFIKPSERKRYLIVIHTIFATTTQIMEKPHTAEKGKEEFTAKQENKVSPGHHSPTATRKHVRTRGQVMFVTRSDTKAERRRSSVVALVRRETPLQMVFDMKGTRQEVSYVGKAGGARYPIENSWEKTSGVVALVRRATPLQMVSDMRRTRQQVLYARKAGDARYP